MGKAVGRAVSLAFCVLVPLMVVAAPKAKNDTPLKLKPGDRIECDHFGTKTGVVLSIDPSGIVQARLDEKDEKVTLFPRHILRKLKKTLATSDVDNPFETDEERLQKKGPRTWTDRSGKHRIQATLLEVEDDAVRLKREDGKEVTLSIDRLSDADQKYLDELNKDNEEAESAEKPEIELTDTNLSSARQLDISATKKWDYVADARQSTKPLPQVRIALGKKPDFFDNPSDILLLPDKQQAFVIFVNNKPGQATYTSRVVACDLGKRKIESSGDFAAGRAPVAITPDGTKLLTKSIGFGGGKNDTLTLCSVVDRQAKPLLAWKPYAPLNNHERDVNCATFIDDQHVLTMGDKGHLALWDLSSKIKPVYLVEGTGKSRPALSAGNKYAALRVKDGVLIFDAVGGKKVGHLPLAEELAWNSCLAFDALGRRLALWQPGRVRVWDLETRALTRDFAVPYGAKGEHLAWVDQDRLLLDGKFVVDAERRVVLWQYDKVPPACLIHGGNLWFIGPGTAQDEQVLASARVPHDAALELVDNVKADDLLVVKPGMKVSLAVELATDREVVLTSLKQRLQDNGMLIDDQTGPIRQVRFNADGAASRLRLVVRSRTGETIKIAYQRFGSFVATEHQFTPQILEMVLEVRGEPVWTWSSSSWAPHHLQLRQGESIDQALAREMKIDPKRIAQVWIPAYIAALPAGRKAGTSDAPAGG